MHTSSDHSESKNDEPPPQLPLHEWLAVALLRGLLFLLALIALLTNHSPSKQHDRHASPQYPINPEIEVVIEGAVEHPGKRLVKRGTFVADALKLASPLPEADLTGFKSTSKVRKNQVIKVPSKLL